MFNVGVAGLRVVWFCFCLYCVCIMCLILCVAWIVFVLCVCVRCVVMCGFGWCVAVAVWCCFFVLRVFLVLCVVCIM